MLTRTTGNRMPIAEEGKPLREAPQVQRERKLWSYLTWSFLLAQIAIVDKLLGPSAHAALDEDALPSSDGSADGQDAAAGKNLGNVAAFTGEDAQQGAAEAHSDAGRFELSGKQPDVTLPDIDIPAGGDAVGPHGLAAGNDADTIASDVQATDTVLTDNPDAELSGPEDGPSDVASLNLDTSIVSDLLDQLDLDALGLVGDVGELAFSTVNGLTAPVFESVSSLTDTLEGLPVLGGALQGVNNLYSQIGQQSDFMLALISGDEQPNIPAALQSFTQSLPLIGDALHQDADDGDLIEIAVVQDVLDTTTSLIDDQLSLKGVGLGLIG